jgi:hypothetical protein
MKKGEVRREKVEAGEESFSFILFLVFLASHISLPTSP